MTTIPQLAHAAVGELRECASVSDERRTVHLRNVANILVDIRELCEDPSGCGPDYTGKSREYRDAVSAIYREVADEIPPNRLRQIKSRIRYHFSSVVRERLHGDVDRLEMYGLHAKSARERNGDCIRQRRALEDAGVIARDEGVSTTAQLVRGAGSLLRLAADRGTGDEDLTTREYIDRALVQVVSHSVELARPRVRVEMARDLLGYLRPAGTDDARDVVAQLDEVLSP